MKNFIITGTSRGIGYELAIKLANSGHRVLAISRTISDSLLNQKNIHNLSIDLSNQKDLEKITLYLNTHWDTIDGVIHNAGSLIFKPFAETSQVDFEKIYNLNVFAVANLTRICLPFLRKGSHVVTISSMGGIQGSLKFAGLSAYSSSKGAVITLTELLAEEFKDQGIAFNVLALGAVQTEMLAEAFPGYQAPITANEMANYIADFTLNGNKYFNGKVIQVSSTNP